MSRAEDDKRWLEFRNRCAETVKKIQVLKDDGHYAQLYAQDVARLIAMLDQLRVDLLKPEGDSHEAAAAAGDQ